MTFTRKKKTMPTGHQFRKGDAWTREQQVKGGKATCASRRKYRAPFEGDMLRMMDIVGMNAASWTPWRTFWRAVFALGLPPGSGTPDHLTRYRAHTGRTAAPKVPVAEAWAVMGRRAGKSRQAALLALFMGIRFDTKQRLSPGELATVPVIAVDRRQARAVFNYLKAFCQVPEFKQYVHLIRKESIDLRTGVTIEVHTASYRSVRGYTIVAVVLDEVAFWAFEADSLNADVEIVDAVRPGLVDDGLLFAISSPYARKGELYEVYERYYGKDDKHVLVWCSDTMSMRPGYPQHRIDRAYEQDPVAAASEYGTDGMVVFRRDVASFIDPASIAAVTVQGRRELPPVPGVKYVGFVDTSGGSQDSYTMAVAHREGADMAVLDCVREIRPPFSPDAATEDYAALFKSYGVHEIEGDRYGGEWPVEVFQHYGITYVPSQRTKSDIYRELLAPINAARIQLLDVPRLKSQLLGLERRVARGGKDSIDHAPRGRDDLINSAAGALVCALPHSGKKKRTVQWSLGADDYHGGTPEQETLRAVAAERARRGLADPCKAPGSVTTRHVYSYPDAPPPPGWEPGEAEYADSASPEFRRATGGGE